MVPLAGAGVTLPRTACTTVPSGSVAVCTALSAVPCTVETSLQSAAISWLPEIGVPVTEMSSTPVIVSLPGASLVMTLTLTSGWLSAAAGRTAATGVVAAADALAT